MRKLLFIFLSLSIFTMLTSQAALYKGQRTFMKVCMKCHKDGEAFVSSKKKTVWKKYMKKKGARLSSVHLKSKKFKKEKKAKKYTKYFKSKKYKKGIKHLKQFLVEYAKDSGNVPACN